VHMDPCRDPECPVCRQVRCELRKSAACLPVPWEPADMTASGRPAERGAIRLAAATGSDRGRGD